jgi:hypothetical protein
MPSDLQGRFYSRTIKGAPACRSLAALTHSGAARRLIWRAHIDGTAAT